MNNESFLDRLLDTRDVSEIRASINKEIDRHVPKPRYDDRHGAMNKTAAEQPEETAKKTRRILNAGIRSSPAAGKKKISETSYRKLARRAGTARIAKPMFQEAENSLVKFLRQIIGDAVVYAEYSSKHTITTEHVLYSLKRNGRTLFPAKK